MTDTTCANENFSLPSLHSRLIALQSLDELKRKSIKARRRGYWTQEEFDYAKCYADYWFQFLANRKPVTIISPRANETTCQCGNTHYWTVGEASWECESCQQHVYERYYGDFRGSDNW